MTVVSVAGPPCRAAQPRIGFPYVLPLSATPPPDWVQHFEAQDWASIDTRLRPPYHPRLEGDRVWLPGIADLTELTQVLDAVVARIEEVDRAYEELVTAHEKRESEGIRKAAERRAQEDAAFEEWASSRPRRPTEP